MMRFRSNANRSVPQTAASTGVDGPTIAPQKPGSRAWYAVWLLLALYVLSFFGRQIISLMVDPLEKSLGLTEVQMGLLIGFSFTLLFTLGGIVSGG